MIASILRRLRPRRSGKSGSADSGDGSDAERGAADRACRAIAFRISCLHPSPRGGARAEGAAARRTAQDYNAPQRNDHRSRRSRDEAGRGSRQALLAKAMDALDVRNIDERLGRAAGELLGITRTTDVIDAALVLLADDGDQILSSDIDDLETLAQAARRYVELLRV